MDPSYNSHILRWKNVRWQNDEPQLLDSIRSCHGREVLARVRQSGRMIEVGNPASELGRRLLQNRIDLAAGFDLEIITRHPGRNGHSKDEFVDRNDFNTLQWNGERGTGALATSRVRNTPMFFRSNGMNADLVDLYAGQTLFLVLNGGSLAGFDWSRLKRQGICTMGVNNGAHAFRPNFWTSVDDPTRFLRSIWADPTITKVIPMSHFEKPIWDVKENRFSDWRVKDFPSVFGYRRNEAFHAEQWLHEDTINWGNHSKRGGGRSVMLAALRIAFLLGFRKVCLLGCDFHMDEKNRYWFAEGRTNHAINNNLNSYRILRGFFEELQPHFLASGFRVFNCNPRSQLEAFPMADLDEELRLAEVDCSATTEGMYVDRYKAQKEASQKKQTPLHKNAPPKKAETAAKTVVAVSNLPQLKGLLDQTQMLQHLTNVVRRCPLQSDPFDHLELRHCFADQTYGELMEHLPDSKHYHELQHADALRNDGTYARLRFAFSGQEIAGLTAKQQAVWSAVRAVLLNRQVEQAFRTVFRNALHQRFGKDFNTLVLQPKLELVRHLEGDKIGIHSDILQKAIAVQFYLPPRGGGAKDWGTTYYCVSGAQKVKVRQMDFLPGAGHAFVVNKKSYHGTDVPIGPGEQRNSLMLTYFVK
ncbi:hypothetical protein GCM10023213_28350 [Prosthecobacter algae]|uniref:Prolyl 4-hydroxylase alpha subunit Fe(2+) 2OG dioxygenase domain-containing protein n=1 Tax=Prosthecobacter algae TaxID=1144682 RepID=A0ABP9PET0_9BACT